MATATKSPEKRIAGWIAGSCQKAQNVRCNDVEAAGWEAGQAACLSLNGLNYEKFEIAGGYVVIEWSPDDGICVL